jgi:hypothetical protein
MTKLALFCNIGSLMWAPEGTLLQLAPKLLSTDPHGARRRFRQAFVWLANQRGIFSSRTLGGTIWSTMPLVEDDFRPLARLFIGGQNSRCSWNRANGILAKHRRCLLTLVSAGT